MPEQDHGDPVDEEIRSDLRATSDSIMFMIETLRAIEATKRQHHPGSAEFLWYAERVQELSQVILGLSTREREAAERADAEPGTSSATVEETPPPSIGELVERWREAERAAAAAEPESEEWGRLVAERDRARNVYHRALDRVNVRESDRTPGS